VVWKGQMGEKGKTATERKISLNKERWEGGAGVKLGGNKRENLKGDAGAEKRWTNET